MFKDYYDILNCSISSNKIQINQAYKNQALKWHPDKNPNIDTTERMQDINEARIILSDSLKRKHYDLEYLKYKKFIRNRSVKSNSDSDGTKDRVHEHYNFSNDKLRDWMKQAREDAVKNLHNMIIEFKDSSIIGVKSFISFILLAFLYILVIYILFGLILLIF